MCYCTPNIRTPYCQNCPYEMHKDMRELKRQLDIKQLDTNKDNDVRIQTVIDIIGGYIEDQPTNITNYIQRLRELILIETMYNKLLDSMREKIRSGQINESSLKYVIDKIIGE